MRSTRFVCDEVADDTGASGGGGGESDDSENGRAVSWLVHNLSDMERGSVEHERKMGGELGGSGGAEVGVGCGVELGSDGVTSGVEHDGGDVPVEHGDDASRPLQRSWSWMSRKAVDVERLRQRKGFLDFVRASMFLTVFLVMMSLHQSIGDVFELERAIKFELTERQWGEQAHVYADVADTLLFWEWFHLGLLPVTVHQMDELGSTLPMSEWGYFVGFNRIVGGIRLRQTRSVHSDCESRLMSEFYNVECFPFESSTTRAFGLPACSGNETTDDLSTADCYDASAYSAVDFLHDEGFSVEDGSTTREFEFWLDTLEPSERISERVHYLEERRWIDRQTKTVIVELLLYNGQSEPLMCEVLLEFEFHRTGLVTATSMIESVPVMPYQNHLALKLALEVAYAWIVVSIAWEESRQIAQAAAKSDLRKALRSHFYSSEAAFGNWISALNVLFGVFLVGVWIPFVLQLDLVTYDLAHLHRPEGLATYVDDDSDAWSKFHHEIVEIEDELSHAINEMKAIRLLGGLNILFVLARLLKDWTHIPALRVVAVTLWKSIARLATFSIIVVSLVMIFAGAGFLLFGHILYEFHSFPEACVTTLVTVFTADAGVYSKQREVDEITAAVWTILVFSMFAMTLVNMVLAIIVDAYEDAKSLHTVHDVALYTTALDAAKHFADPLRTRRTMHKVSNAMRRRLRQKAHRRKQLAAVLPNSTSTGDLEWQPGGPTPARPETGFPRISTW